MYLDRTFARRIGSAKFKSNSEDTQCHISHCVDNRTSKTRHTRHKHIEPDTYTATPSVKKVGVGWGRKLQFSDGQLKISDRGDYSCSLVQF